MKKAYMNATLIAVVVSVVLLFGNPLRAQSFNLIDGQPIHTQADLDSLSTGDTVVVVCPKCKGMAMTTYSSDPSSPGHVKWLEAGFTKTCSMCGGKAKTKTINGKTVLVCDKCNEADIITAFKTSQK